MIRATFYALLSLLLIYSAAPGQTALTHLTIVDVRSGSLKRNMTIVISGRRIESVGTAQRTRVPEQAWVIDSRGLYLMPVFWDMHIHVDSHEPPLRPLVASALPGT